MQSKNAQSEMSRQKHERLLLVVRPGTFNGIAHHRVAGGGAQADAN
jgi:hypothetical protein